MEQGARIENMGGGISLAVSKAHGFGTDSLLLSWFAAPKARDLAVDLCAGCGVVPILWFREAGPAQAWGLELQPEAVEQMTESVRQSGLEGRFHPVLGDLRQAAGLLPRQHYTLITCNPPYRTPGTGALSGDDSRRTARHETMCSLEDVVAAADTLLSTGGRLCLCHLAERLVDVLAVMRSRGIEPKRLRLCQSRPGKAPWLALVEGKKGARPGLKAEPVLLMEGESGPGPEAREIARWFGNRES